MVEDRAGVSSEQLGGFLELQEFLVVVGERRLWLLRRRAHSTHPLPRRSWTSRACGAQSAIRPRWGWSSTATASLAHRLISHNRHRHAGRGASSLALLAVPLPSIAPRAPGAPRATPFPPPRSGRSLRSRRAFASPVSRLRLAFSPARGSGPPFAVKLLGEQREVPGVLGLGDFSQPSFISLSYLCGRWSIT